MSEADFLAGPGEPGLVSVVVPTFNRAHVIEVTINSILAQTYTNFEVLVIDDGSKDNTSEVIARYTDPRIRYIRTANGGMSAARNCGLAAARGEFIAFLDSDDTWLPWKLAAQIELLKREPDVGVVWTDMSSFTENPADVLDERFIRKYYTVYQRISIESAMRRAYTLADLSKEAPPALAGSPCYVGDVFREMFHGSLVHPSTAVVRRDRLRKAGGFEFELTGPGAEDYHFYYRIAEHGPAAFLDAPTTMYRIGHASQLSRVTLAQARGNLAVVLHWLKRRPPELPQAVIRDRLATSYFWAGKEELTDGDLRVARHHLRESFRLHPRPSTLGLYVASLLPQGSVPLLRGIKHGGRTTGGTPAVLLAAVIGSSFLWMAVRLLAATAPGARLAILLR